MLQVNETFASPDRDPANNLTQVLISGDFRDALAALGQHSILVGLEGGYVAYADGSSRIELPSLETAKKKASARLGLEALRAAYTDFDPSGLVTAKKRPLKDVTDVDTWLEEPAKYRSDITLLLHSHPVQPHASKSTPLDYLAPSLGDLESWEVLSSHNAKLVEGVLVATDETKKLLLWHKDPNAPGHPYYAQYAGGEAPSRNTLLRVMKESGLRVATLDLGEGEESYNEDAIQAAKELFT